MTLLLLLLIRLLLLLLLADAVCECVRVCMNGRTCAYYMGEV